jgi:hypothetical protein
LVGSHDGEPRRVVLFPAMWLLRWILESRGSSEIDLLIFFVLSFATRFRVGVLALVGKRDLRAVEKKVVGCSCRW